MKGHRSTTHDNLLYGINLEAQVHDIYPTATILSRLTPRSMIVAGFITSSIAIFSSTYNTTVRDHVKAKINATMLLHIS